ncbi:glycerophosphodiester phosphodiesterase family protein [Alloalcanivorax mobilis]|uniref:glycerophosphodiester phosphodiesterase family protein n=1 Tax=Alloalcanivorax mobilis TaxID=2019569 RepID=UPI000C7909AC|nr:glycerophosphodiester phosphodiesterase family protein [Alloalcanivorax mobilis]
MPLSLSLRRCLAGALLISCGQTLAASAELTARAFRYHGPGAPVLVVAHRADWRAAPENSLAAIRSAIDKRIPMVEIDVRMSADGEMVLMHDGSVDRTTNGHGAVSAMTLAQIKALRLKQGLGGDQAPLTDETVPTLAEVMALSKGRIMLQIDKAWALREPIYQLLTAANMVNQVVFKSDADPAQAQAFMRRDPRILYMHIVNDDNAGDFYAFGDPMPQAFEINYDRLTDEQIQPAYIDDVRRNARIFANTMWEGLSAGYTDEASLRDPALGWKTVIERHHASVIQTDNPVALMDYLTPAWPHRWLNNADVVIQAEDYVTDGKDEGYHDQDDENRGGDVYRPYEGVDVCNQEGAINLCWIRAGEWAVYRFQVPRSGYYHVEARVSSPYNPAGRFTLEFDDDGAPLDVAVATTTSHDAFESQPAGGRYFGRGEHQLRFHVSEGEYQNFNVDYFKLTRR